MKGCMARNTLIRVVHLLTKWKIDRDILVIYQTIGELQHIAYSQDKHR